MDPLELPLSSEFLLLGGSFKQLGRAVILELALDKCIRREADVLFATDLPPKHHLDAWHRIRAKPGRRAQGWMRNHRRYRADALGPLHEAGLFKGKQLVRPEAADTMRWRLCDAVTYRPSARALCLASLLVDVPGTFPPALERTVRRLIAETGSGPVEFLRTL